MKDLEFKPFKSFKQFKTFKRIEKIAYLPLNCAVRFSM
jgi:hypothetical protein